MPLKENLLQNTRRLTPALRDEALTFGFRVNVGFQFNGPPTLGSCCPVTGDLFKLAQESVDGLHVRRGEEGF